MEETEEEEEQRVVVVDASISASLSLSLFFLLHYQSDTGATTAEAGSKAAAAVASFGE